MKYWKVKNKKTDRVTVISEEIFKNLSENKNFFIDSDKTEKKIVDDEEIEVPIKVTPFEKIEEVDENGLTPSEAKIYKDTYESEKKEKKKLLKKK